MSRRPRHALAALVLALAAALTLSACGDGTGDDTAAGAEESSASESGFDEADVAFAQQMIPHHQQAVQMARMADTHASGPDVRRLAAAIESAQAPEIKTMTGWLKAWGKDVPDGSMVHMNHDRQDMSGMGGMGGMDRMPGMMSDRQLRSLGRSTGDAWDTMFLRMMIAHHEGAIEMAKAEIADGRNADAVALARRIVTAQQAEIDQMREMLRS